MLRRVRGTGYPCARARPAPRNRDARDRRPALRHRDDTFARDARGDVGYTQRHHAVPVNMPNVLLEIRQDLIAEPAGQERWAKLLAEHLGPILVDETLWAEAATDRS